MHPAIFAVLFRVTLCSLPVAVPVQEGVRAGRVSLELNLGDWFNPFETFPAGSVSSRQTRMAVRRLVTSDSNTATYKLGQELLIQYIASAEEEWGLAQNAARIIDILNEAVPGLTPNLLVVSNPAQTPTFEEFCAITGIDRTTRPALVKIPERTPDALYVSYIVTEDSGDTLRISLERNRKMSMESALEKGAFLLGMVRRMHETTGVVHGNVSLKTVAMSVRVFSDQLLVLIGFEHAEWEARRHVVPEIACRTQNFPTHPSARSDVLAVLFVVAQLVQGIQFAETMESLCANDTGLFRKIVYEKNWLNFRLGWLVPIHFRVFGLPDAFLRLFQQALAVARTPSEDPPEYDRLQDLLREMQRMTLLSGI